MCGANGTTCGGVLRGTGCVLGIGDDLASALEFRPKACCQEKGFFRIIVPVSPVLLRIGDVIQDLHVLGKADDLLSRLDLNLFRLSDGDSEIKSPIGRYGKDHWDVSMYSLVVHNIGPQIGP